jgi:dihydropteroate synthase
VKEEKHAKNDVVRVTGVRSVHDVEKGKDARSVHDVEKGKDARSVHDVEKGKDARSVHDAVRVKRVLGSANERPQVRRVQRTHATSVVA